MGDFVRPQSGWGRSKPDLFTHGGSAGDLRAVLTGQLGGVVLDDEPAGGSHAHLGGAGALGPDAVHHLLFGGPGLPLGNGGLDLVHMDDLVGMADRDTGLQQGEEPGVRRLLGQVEAGVVRLQLLALAEPPLHLALGKGVGFGAPVRLPEGLVLPLHPLELHPLLRGHPRLFSGLGEEGVVLLHRGQELGAVGVGNTIALGEKVQDGLGAADLPFQVLGLLESPADDPLDLLVELRFILPAAGDQLQKGFALGFPCVAPQGGLSYPFGVIFLGHGSRFRRRALPCFLPGGGRLSLSSGGLLRLLAVQHRLLARFLAPPGGDRACRFGTARVISTDLARGRAPSSLSSDSGAAVEEVQPDTFTEAVSIAMDRDDYEQIPEDMDEYGKQVLRRAGADDEVIDTIDGYMDFSQLGEDSMAEDGVRRTEFGLVRRLSKPFPPEPEIGQAMM